MYSSTSAGTSMSDPSSSRSGREALRGAEVHTLDLIFEVLTSQQWAELLKAPLQRAAAMGTRDLAQRLVRAGAEIGTALHEAIKGGHGEVVNDLLESGASLTAMGSTGYTPLHFAAGQGKSEIVRLLLLKGADKDAFDIAEMTPLFLTAHRGHVAAALALLAAGVDVSLRCGQAKIPAMYVAAQQGHAEILRALIKHGADVDAVDDVHHTVALHEAASKNKTDAIDLLVEAGTDVEVRTRDGLTPLHCASYNLRPEALLRLLKHGAYVNAQDDDLETPLICAAARAGTQGTATVVDSLLRAGADETIVDDEGRKAADVIGDEVEEEERLAEDAERVRELLTNAPADRAWRRRGYLIMCRAHPDRVQQNHVISGATHHADTARRTRSRAKLIRAGGSTGDSISVDEGTGGDWAVVVSKVLWLQEEGIFRTIVGYL